jgi:hypothetical protein
MTLPIEPMSMCMMTTTEGLQGAGSVAMMRQSGARTPEDAAITSLLMPVQRQTSWHPPQLDKLQAAFPVWPRNPSPGTRPALGQQRVQSVALGASLLVHAKASRPRVIT